MKTAVITGITGQDGAYLAQFLLQRGYRVVGTFRRTSSTGFLRLRTLNLLDHAALQLRECDLTDLVSLLRLLGEVRPDEVYNLAAQSFVGTSFEQPLATAQITGIGALHMLEAVRMACPEARFYQASSSEMFGMATETPQRETTPFHPKSPYGVSKAFAHWATVNYREAHGLFAVSGILFNHESPLRGHEFVTRKISMAAARAARSERAVLSLGNLDARRDWGHAKDYVEGMWRMLQADRPDTYVLATGRSESVRTFTTLAYAAAGLEIEWEGDGPAEQARCRKQGRLLVQLDRRYLRPSEVDHLVGDASKARSLLDWSPSCTLESLCERMVAADLSSIDGAVHA